VDGVDIVDWVDKKRTDYRLWSARLILNVYQAVQ